MKSKILFFGKEGDANTKIAIDWVRQYFPNTIFYDTKRGITFPEEAYEWEGDYIISYLSQWIIPDRMLQKAKISAMNFHPGPPEYPGIGCTNFAIYNKEKEFGITCHEMLGKVDTGKVIRVKRFPLFEEDTVWTITQKCYSVILEVFRDTLDLIVQGLPLPTSDEHWTRKPYTRKELNALCEITLDMSEQEILRRIKATTFDKPWAFVKIAGKTFKYDGK